MTDPAIDAAQRAWGFDKDAKFFERTVGQMSVSAAREMAKSVQELHRPESHCYRCDGRQPCWPGPCLDGRACVTCGPMSPWPCATAKRVYPSEELER